LNLAPDRVQKAAVASSAAVLFLYFFWGGPPAGADGVSVALILALWAASMALDLHITMANGHHIRRHESSVLVRLVYGRLSDPAAAAVIIAAESACVVLLPAATTFRLDPDGSMAVAYLFCLLHACAILSNERFVADHAAGSR